MVKTLSHQEMRMRFMFWQVLCFKSDQFLFRIRTRIIQQLFLPFELSFRSAISRLSFLSRELPVTWLTIRSALPA
jgi:hypothetical protein